MTIIRALAEEEGRPKEKMNTKLREIKGEGSLETFRISLELPKGNMDELNRLKRSLNIATNSELIRFSLGLMLLVTRHMDDGYEMLFRKGNEAKSVLMPFSSLGGKVRGVEG